MPTVIPELAVVTVDIDAEHGAGFSVDRPAGSGDWTLLHLVTPATVLDRHGRQQARADACLLISPDQPQHLATLGGRLVNHYAHLRGAGLAPLIARLGLPVDELAYPRPIGFLRDQLAELRQHWAQGGEHAEVLLPFLVGRLLATLARRLGGAEGTGAALNPSLLERLRQIRRWLVESPGEHQSAAWIAQQAGVSAPYLSAVWRRTFGSAPQEDLIRIRLERACRLLEEGALPVAEVAARSGFADAHYFSRLFRRRHGCTPSAWAARGRGTRT